MPRSVPLTLFSITAVCVMACAGGGSKTRPTPTSAPATVAGDQAPDHDETTAEEARARWLADARATKKAELERLAAAAATKAVAAREAYKKAYHAGVGITKQQALKKDAETLEADAERAQAAIAGADSYEPPPPADDRPVVAVGPSSAGGRTVHVNGYRRKDGTYVPPHTRSAPRR